MGYSISVSFSKKENKEQIKTFLLQQEELLTELQKTDSRIPYFSLDISDEKSLAYAPKKRNLLGFHGSGIPHYAWAICAWMAVQSNPKKPFLYYDDEPLEIIYEHEQKENEKRTIVNHDGIMVLPKKSLTSQLLLGLFDIGVHHKKEQEILTKLHENWLVFQENLKHQSQPISKKSLKPI
jgi:hypothetical protein